MVKGYFHDKIQPVLNRKSIGGTANKQVPIITADTEFLFRQLITVENEYSILKAITPRF
jgi:hypothetical protein